MSSTAHIQVQFSLYVSSSLSLLPHPRDVSRFWSTHTYGNRRTDRLTDRVTDSWTDSPEVLVNGWNGNLKSLRRLYWFFFPFISLHSIFFLSIPAAQWKCQHVSIQNMKMRLGKGGGAMPRYKCIVNMSSRYIGISSSSSPHPGSCHCLLSFLFPILFAPLFLYFFFAATSLAT